MYRSSCPPCLSAWLFPPVALALSCLACRPDAPPSRLFAYRLEAGEYLAARASQDSGDVVIELRRPGDPEPLVFDSPTGTEEPEEIRVVAENAGDHRFEVRYLETGRRPPPDALQVVERRPARSEDRRRTAALHRLMEAETLRKRRLGDQAATKYRAARDAWAALGTPPEALVAWRRSIRLANERLRIADAAALCDDAAEFPFLAERRREAARFQYECGSAYRMSGRLEDSETFHRKALGISEAIDYPHGRGLALQGLALVTRDLGDLDRSLEHFREALSVFEARGDGPSTASALYNVGRLRLLLDRPRPALDALRRALDIHLQDGVDPSHVLASMGFAHTLLGERDEALRTYRRALDLQRSGGNPLVEAVVRDFLGRFHLENGAPEAALEELRRALAIFEDLDHPQSVVNTLANLGSLHLTLGRLGNAERLLERALAKLEEVDDRNAEAHVLGTLALLARRRGQLETARSRVEAALEVIESMRGPSHWHAQASHFATLRDYYRLHADLLLELDRRRPEDGLAALAFHAGERGRGRALLDRLAGSHQPKGDAIPAALREQERRLRERITIHQLRALALAQEDTGDPRYEALRRELRRDLDLHDALQARIRATGDGPRLDGEPPEPLGVAEIQELLDGDTVLLRYDLGEDRSLLWLVTAESFRYVELAPRDVIERRAEDLHAALRRGHDPHSGGLLRRIARELGDLVLAPARDHLAKRLVIVPDGKLHYVPFAALPATSSPGREPIVRHHEIVRLPSASVLREIRRRGRQVEYRAELTVVGDPVTHPEDERLAAKAAPVPPAAPAFPRLPSSRAEVETLRALAPGGTVLAGFDAAKEPLLHGGIAPSRVLHFAAHGLLDEENPELSALVLSRFDARGAARDGLLRLDEIYRLRLRADLVVLSACETAAGPLVGGEGLLAMAQGFLSAGATRVLATLWRIDDRATAALMEVFYRALLRGGQAPAAALRTAQLAMLDHERWHRPYFWAGFVLQGEWL